MKTLLSDVKTLKDKPPHTNRGLGFAINIIADKAIQDFYEINPKHSWGKKEDFSNYLPPGPVTWVEAKAPEYIKSNTTGLEKWGDNRWQRIGALVSLAPYELLLTQPNYSLFAAEFPPNFDKELKILLTYDIYLDHPAEFKSAGLVHPVQHYAHCMVGLDKSLSPICMEGNYITMLCRPGEMFTQFDKKKTMDAFKQNVAGIQYLLYPLMHCISFGTQKRVRLEDIKIDGVNFKKFSL